MVIILGACRVRNPISSSTFFAAPRATLYKVRAAPVCARLFSFTQILELDILRVFLNYDSRPNLQGINYINFF